MTLPAALAQRAGAFDDEADAHDRAAIAEAEHALYRAQTASDPAAIAPMLDDDLVYVHSTGVAETRAGYLAGVEGRLYEYGRIESRDVSLRICGDLALQHGIVAMEVAAHGAPKILIQLLFCLAWRRRDGTWRLAYRQATRIPDAS